MFVGSRQHLSYIYKQYEDAGICRKKLEFYSEEQFGINCICHKLRIRSVDSFEFARQYTLDSFRFSQFGLFLSKTEEILQWRRDHFLFIDLKSDQTRRSEVCFKTPLIDMIHIANESQIIGLAEEQATLFVFGRGGDDLCLLRQIDFAPASYMFERYIGFTSRTKLEREILLANNRLRFIKISKHLETTIKQETYKIVNDFTNDLLNITVYETVELKKNNSLLLLMKCYNLHVVLISRKVKQIIKRIVLQIPAFQTDNYYICPNILFDKSGIQKIMLVAMHQQNEITLLIQFQTLENTKIDTNVAWLNGKTGYFWQNLARGQDFALVMECIDQNKATHESFVKFRMIDMSLTEKEETQKV